MSYDVNIKFEQEGGEKIVTPVEKFTDAVNDATRATNHYRDANGRLRDAQGQYVKGAAAAERQTDRNRRSLMRVDRQAYKTRRSLMDMGGGMAKSMAGFAAGAITIGTVGATLRSLRDEAMQFDQSMANVRTLNGGNLEDIEDLKRGIMELSREMPVTPNDLGVSAYDAYSAGAKNAAEAVDLLRSSTRLSIAGRGEQEVALRMTAKAINAWGYEIKDAEEVTNAFFWTVKNGITDVNQLERGFGAMASAATSANVSLQDAQAQTAALTAAGIPSAQAQAFQAAMFNEVTKSSGPFSDALKKLRWNTTDLTKRIGDRGFVTTLKDMQRELKYSDLEMKNIFGSSEAGRAAFSLLTNANEKHNETLREMGGDMAAYDQAVSDGADNAVAAQKRIDAAWQRLALMAADEGVLDSYADLLDGLGDLLDEHGPTIAKGMGDVAESLRFLTGLEKPEEGWFTGTIEEIAAAMAAAKPKEAGLSWVDFFPAPSELKGTGIDAAISDLVNQPFKEAAAQLKAEMRLWERLSALLEATRNRVQTAAGPRACLA